MPTKLLPTLSLFYEDSKEFRPLKLGTWNLEEYFSGLDSRRTVAHDKSFGVLRVVLQGSNSNNFQLLVDGKYAPLSPMGHEWVANIPLSYDIEFHRISVLARPRLALTMDFVVEHVYFLKGAGGAGIGFSKWSKETYEAELMRLSPLFKQRKQAGVQIETIARGFGAAEDDNIALALLQTCGRLTSRLESALAHEMLIDFGTPTAGEVDREGLLAQIKDDFRRLQRSPTGSICINGERFTSSVNVRTEAKGTRPDLTSVSAVLQTASELLRESSCPAAVIGILLDTTIDIERYCLPNRAVSIDISRLVNKPMYSGFGIDIQGLCRQLLLLVAKQLGRDARDHGIFWLKRAVRDFDVFETAAFASCASAFGFSSNEITECQSGVLEKQEVTVANVNTAAGRQLFMSSIKGWRNSSIQPSGYHPDAIVVLNGSYPVLIDAKFRVPTSIEMLAHPDGVKDVQAYLDDFGMNGAVIIVPRIMNPELCVTPGMGLIQSTDRHGKHRIIAIVEMQRGDEPEAVENIKKAVTLVAARTH